MSKLLKLDLNAGLNVAQGHYTRPNGALKVARNMVVDAPGVIRSRQGFERQPEAAGCIYKGVSFPELGGPGAPFLVNAGDSSGPTELLRGDGVVPWSTVDSNFTNSAQRMQAAVGRGNIYMTSDEGLRRYESSGTLYYAGMPWSLECSQNNTATPVLVGTGGFLADNEQVAYRVTFVRDDADGLPMESAPSSRSVIIKNANTTGNAPGVVQNVQLLVNLPDSVGQNGVPLTTEYSVRVWRSAVSSSGAPPDDMRLVLEQKLTALQISGGFVLFVDSTPEGFRILSPPLYTNANDGGENGVGGPGIQQANVPPPRPRAVETFADCLFIGNLLGYHVLEFTILSTVAGTGLTAGDTLTIGGITYTGVVPGGAPLPDRFDVWPTGAITPSEALARTAQDLVRCINYWTSTNANVYAFYVPGPNELPGKIRLVSKTIAYGPFTAVASAHGDAYRPQLGSAVASKAENQPNALMFSKPSQPDAIPSVNQFFVGRKSNEILALRRLRNVLYVFGTAGVWRVVGSDPLSFSLEEVTDTISILGSELVCSCDDALYGMSANGVWRFTEGGGPELVSNPIEPLIWQAVHGSAASYEIAYSGWSCAYRTRHKVIFALPAEFGNPGCNTIFCMDTRLGAWTTWDFVENEEQWYLGPSCGFVAAQDDTMRLGSWTQSGFDTGYICSERLSYTLNDYRDFDIASGGSQIILRRVTLNVASTSPDDVQNFDEVHILWEQSDVFPDLGPPDGEVSLRFTADGGNPSGQIALTNSPGGNASSRQLVPQSQRTSSRLLLEINGPTDATSYFSIEGVAFEVQDSGSNRTRRQ